MKNKEYMNISEFAKIAGANRRTLLFYDKIGLFSPAVVGNNGYRYYTMQQFYTIDTINLLKSVGMSLKDVKEFMQTRTPQKSLELFIKQEREIFAEIERLTFFHKSLQTRIWRIKQAGAFELNKVVLEKCPAEYFLASERFPNAEDINSMKIYFQFLATLNEQRLDIGYPMGSIYRINDFLEEAASQEYQMIQRIDGNDFPKYRNREIVKKPAGHYVTEFSSGEQNPPGFLTDRMKKYIAQNHLQVAETAWEFWWQDDSITKNPGEHIYQTSVQVKKKPHHNRSSK